MRQAELPPGPRRRGDLRADPELSGLPLLGAGATLLLGLLGLLRPSAAATFTSIEPVGLVGRSEIRATYGGFFVALGAYCLVTREPAAFTIVGLAWLGAALGRLLSAAVDRSRSGQNLGGIVFEAAIGASLLSPWLLAAR